MAQLCREQETLQRLNTEVLLVSFGDERQAGRWLEETCASFRLLLDPQRRLYDTYGLPRSITGSWNVKTLLRYAELMRAGRRWRGIQGDSTQLGGDFIIDSRGTIRLAYRSKDPTDRPAVTDVLEILREMEEANAASGSVSRRQSLDT